MIGAEQPKLSGESVERAHALCARAGGGPLEVVLSSSVTRSRRWLSERVQP
jgi:hypothetical protein